MNQYPHLFSPIKVGNLTIKNRIQLLPFYITRQAADGGFPDDYIAYIERLAKGGTGLVTLGEVVVSDKTGNGHPSTVRLMDPKCLRRLALIAEKVHRYGAKVSIEVNHAGMLAHPQYNNGRPAYAPSECDTSSWDRVPAEYVVMDEAMMNEVADDYATAIANLKQCGFDMAMIHFANGWLMTQFLSPRTNHRTDQYGGSLENRCRFPMMVLDRIRERVGKDFPLALRMTIDEMLPGGITLEEGIQMAKLFESKVDMLDCVRGSLQVTNATCWTSASYFHPAMNNIEAVAKVKEAVSIPVGAGASLSHPDDAERLLVEGKVDFVCMARQLIADTDWPKKVRAGKIDEINQCLRCNSCVNAMGRGVEKALRCAVNPLRGHELEFERNWEDPAPAEVKKQVLIIGAGPAGLVAALTASRRGHQVILVEKQDHMGGALDFADYASAKYAVKNYKDRLIRRVEAMPNVEIRLNTTATRAMIEEIAPDNVIIAIGAKMRNFPIAGLENASIIPGQDSYKRADEVGDNVIVLGGGLQGAEIAIHFAELGKTVAIIEARDEIAAVNISQAADSKGRFKGAADTLQQVVWQRIDELEIEKYTSTLCKEIVGNKVIAIQNEKEIELEADTIINSLGMAPLQEQAYELAGDGSIEFAVVGDCDKVGKIKDAMSAAYFAAMNI